MQRRDDPLRLLREVNTSVFHWFDYVPKATRVDSPIDEALRSRAGVCQDLSHIMTALVRSLRIPCRYVSGYLYHGDRHHDRSSEGASHAWVEAFLPGSRLDGFRSHQQPDRRRAPHPRRGRPRLRRCSAHPRRLPRRRGKRTGSRGHRRPFRAAAAAIEELNISQEDWSVFLHPEEEMVQQQQQQQQ